MNKATNVAIVAGAVVANLAISYGINTYFSKLRARMIAKSLTK